jgi:dTDP-L-rhamnose 4-epimerase
VDAVVHQAAKVGLGVGAADLPAYVSTNDLGTAVLLAGMAEAGVRPLVLASSMVVYGEGRYDCSEHGRMRPPPRQRDDLEAGIFEPRCPVCSSPLRWGRVAEDDRLDPRSAYAATKVAQEHLATVWASMTGGVVVALRYHNVYGRGMPRNTPYAGVAAIWRSALLRDEAPRVFEDGGQMRDFVHVRDVAAANVLALGRAAVLPPGSVLACNVASGQPRPISDLARALTEALGGPDPVVTGQWRAGDVRHVVAGAERARSELGFIAQVPFADGVQDLAVDG